MRRTRIAAVILMCLALAAVALARVGGGESYSGGGSSSSGSSSDSSYSGSGSSGSSDSGSGGGSSGTPPTAGQVVGVLACFALAFIFLAAVVYALVRFNLVTMTSPEPPIPIYVVDVPPLVPERRPPKEPMESLRRFDPNFSRIVFEDFCYSLYARVHHARGAGDLGRYAPYLSEAARNSMMQRGPKGLTGVDGVVIGAITVRDLEGEGTPDVSVTVMYDANFTETTASGAASWYMRETWTFERKRDILSPPPAKARAEHCPRCGAALETRTDGSCNYCGVKIEDGAFQWYVRSMKVIRKEPRGPLLTSNVPEVGTDRPLVAQRGLEQRRAAFQKTHPRFQWDDFEARSRQIATALQDAWTARDSERMRPLETETLFQTHRYWIDAYLRQHLKNLVTDYTIGSIHLSKISADAFYDAITVRLAAKGYDHTVNEGGMVIAGSRYHRRSWTEYWTLIRTRGTEADPSEMVSCPNCGAAVPVGATGICPHCAGKLTGGEFGWVLSRIEQDESYHA